jgi:hypothetical protein
MKLTNSMRFGVGVVALLGSFALGAQVSDHSAPFDGYWWRAASAEQRTIYVFGWEMGVNQGEIYGCQEALPSDKPAADRCVLNGIMNRITTGVSIGQMVAMVDNYYDDPNHAADTPSTALTNKLSAHYKQLH